MTTPQERAEQKRQDQLKVMREQVDSGELTIRKMTSAERAKNPPRPRQAKPKRG